MASDVALLQEYARSRNADIFAELVRRHAGMVYGVCLRITGDAHDAEDIAQECLLALARAAGSVTSSVPGWLHATATTRSKDAVRKASRRRQREQLAATLISGRCANSTSEENPPNGGPGSSSQTIGGMESRLRRWRDSTGRCSGKNPPRNKITLRPLDTDDDAD